MTTARLLLALALAALAARYGSTTPVAFAPVALAPGTSCASLASIGLSDTIIKVAEEVAGPAFAPPGGGPINGLPRFCRVAGVSKPTVNFEVWLPVDGWNGKFQGVGNGANAGSIVYGAMATAIRRGYATASTDTGHATTNSRDGQWAVGHPELVADFLLPQRNANWTSFLDDSASL